MPSLPRLAAAEVGQKVLFALALGLANSCCDAGYCLWSILFFIKIFRFFVKDMCYYL